MALLVIQMLESSITVSPLMAFYAHLALAIFLTQVSICLCVCVCGMVSIAQLIARVYP